MAPLLLQPTRDSHDVHKFQTVLCVNDILHRSYQPVVMPYQARCYAI